MSEWDVSKTDFGAVAETGQDCFDAGYCTGWLFSGKAQFLNASGSVVSTLTNPPVGGCYSGAYNIHDFHVDRCRSGVLSVPISANRIKFTWNLAFQRSDGYWFSWPQVTKTVPIS
jgi:hypothetical protein